MSRQVMLVGDKDTGHGSCPPTAITSGSPTVQINGRAVARQGDPLAPHRKPKGSTHGRHIASGEPTCLVDGRSIALTGHPVNCGGTLVVGAGKGVTVGSV